MHDIISFFISILIALHVVAAPVPVSVATSTVAARPPVLIETPDITIYAPTINGVQTQPEDWQCEGTMCSQAIEVQVVPTTPEPVKQSTFITPSGAVIGADGTVLYAPQSASAPQPVSQPAPKTKPDTGLTSYPSTQSDVVPASQAPTEQECKTVYAHRTGSVAWYRCQALYGNQN